MVLRFGDYELDESAAELRHRGRVVEIQPKPFALLALLLKERARVVPTRELNAALWPDTSVSPASLTRAISHARKAIGDSNRGTRIQSFSRRGYRYCGEVIELERGAAAPSAGGVEAKPFVGRADALAVLERAFAEAANGRGSVAIVHGPAGIGKTRLIEHFGASVAARGARVLVGRNRAEEGVPPFWLWVQILRQLRDVDGARALLEVELEEQDSERKRFLRFDSVTRALQRASRAQTLVIVLEDLHVADPPSLRLLEHLAYETSADRITVLATVRTEFRKRGHPLDRTLAVLRQLERNREVELAGFTRAEVAALLAQALGRPAPSDLISDLFARTDGVPLFLREAIRLLDERGALEAPEKIPRAGVGLPARALDLIGRSLLALSDSGAALIGAAAVLGREFTLGAAAEVAGLPRQRALDCVDEATRVGVLEASPHDPASWRFTHALFHEAAYAAIAAGARVRLHLRAAERLEREHAADLESVIAELAHHHGRALAVGDPERAFECAMRAAERADRLGAWEQADQHYEQAVAALAHVRAVAPERRLHVLLARGESARLAGERVRRREVLNEAMAIARAHGRCEDLARAAIGFSDLQDWGVRDEAARAAVGEALSALAEGGGVLRARLLTRMAYFDVRDSHDAAQPVAREAVALARGAGDAEALQDALYVLHFALGGPDHVAEREALAEEIARVAPSSRSGDRALITLLDVASDRVMLGDLAGANAFRARAVAIAGERPQPAMRWNQGVYDTGMALLEGRLDDAEALMRDSFVLGRRVGHPYARAVLNGHRVLLAAERGDVGETLTVLEPAIGAPVGPQHWLLARVARARLAVGREADARALFDSLARAQFADVPRNLRWTGTLVELAHLCAELGDSARAAPLEALLAPFEHQHAVMPIAILYGGPVRFALARLAETVGRNDDARALYAEAARDAAALGARPTEARIAQLAYSAAKS